MTEPQAAIVVGILGQWASGKTEAARTLIRHLGGEGNVVFLTDRGLFASQAIKHLLEREDFEVEVCIEEDGRQRLDCELVTAWLAPGEDLRSVEPSTLRFEVHDDETIVAFRWRAKLELGHQIRERSAGGRPVVFEAAFGPNPEPAGENPYGRTIADLFARLERAGVDPHQVKWIIVEARGDTRAARNAQRPDRIPIHYFERFAADGGDLARDHERRLVEQGTLIRRVPNDHDDVERFRADIVAAFEDMVGRDAGQPIAIDRQLETARCRLRYPRIGDVARLLSAFSSPQFPNDLPLAECTTVEQVTGWVEGCQTRWAQGESYTWTVEDTASGTIVGQVTLARLPDGERWALAFWTHPDCWGQRYATEAAQRGIRFAFEELEASRVWAAAATWNQASRRVLHRLGMNYVGDNPQGYTIQGRPIPTLEFEIARADWQP